MTSESQPVTQQGRMATPAKVCFSFQLCLTLLLGQKCSAPPGALPPNPGLPLLPFWDLPSSTLWSPISGVVQVKEEMLPLISLWPIITCYLGAVFDVLTCHPAQLGLLQHCCLHVAPSPQSRRWSFVPFSCHLCTLLIFTVGQGS